MKEWARKEAKAISSVQCNAITTLGYMSNRWTTFVVSLLSRDCAHFLCSRTARANGMCIYLTDLARAERFRALFCEIYSRARILQELPIRQISSGNFTMFHECYAFVCSRGRAFFFLTATCALFSRSCFVTRIVLFLFNVKRMKVQSCSSKVHTKFFSP